MIESCRFAVAVAVLSAFCAAQNINDVHVRPPAPGTAPAADAKQTHLKPFVSNVDVVLVPVTVTDTATRIVTGLQRSHFLVLEDGKPQTIEYFYTQDAPISMGIIFDMSGSMGDAVNTSRDAVKEFMQASNPDDEFFLITFADKPNYVGNFTDRPEDIAGELVYTHSHGLTALWDSVYLGLSKMRAAKNAKRVLMVFSDGGENHSRYSAKELLRLVREADVQIYGVAIPCQDYGPGGMAAISGATGGRTFLGPPSTFGDIASKVAIELRNQYVVGYRPTNRAHDGKYRKIRVKLQPPKGLPPLVVTAKKNGYYAPDK
ncbi:MAG: VWA domain-containing protein [Terriglobales bacterium]